MPLANELLLLALITRDDSGWMWMVYVFMTALGAVCGVSMVDSLMRRAGEEGLKRFVKSERTKWLESKLEDHAFWVVCTASAMPPPFPFRVVVLTASALQSPRKTLLTAVFTGRLIRFSVEGLIILYYGRRLLVYLNSDLLDYLMYALFTLAVLGSTISIYRWISRVAHTTTP